MTKQEAPGICLPTQTTIKLAEYDITILEFWSEVLKLPGKDFDGKLW